MPGARHHTLVRGFNRSPIFIGGEDFDHHPGGLKSK
jgi:hypothetical protein